MQDDELFSQTLEIDEEEVTSAAQERGIAVDLDDELRLLAKRNHLRLLKKDACREPREPGRWRAEALLQFQSMTDAACHFTWISLTIKVTPTPGAVVIGVDPTRGGKQDVKYVRKISPSIEATIPGLSVKTTLAGEKSVEYTVEYPTLVGTNFEDRANWTFRAVADEQELVLDHPLIVSVEFPRTPPCGLRATIEVRARIAFRDWKRSIPLIGRRTATEERVVGLDS